MLFLLLACTSATPASSDDGASSGSPTDTGPADGGTTDGATGDGGTGDGGTGDGGTGDGGTTDGSTTGDPSAAWDVLIRDVHLAGALDGSGAALPHGLVADVAIDDGRIVALGTLDGTAVAVVDGHDRWLAPAFIDSHVHLAYWEVGPELAAGGVAAAVDLAAPVDIFDAPAGGALRGPLTLLVAGPMVTAEGGYPTRSWGRDGYGIECADADDVRAAVDDLADRGASVIKVPVTSSPVLGPDALAAAADAAHGHGLKVATHALSVSQAAAARTAGFDLLAHTPTDRLSASTIAAWSGGAVVSTLRAFGGADARANLIDLQAAGATVLYGTDLGNSRTAAIDGDELTALQAAGLDGAAILAAGTSAPAAFWGLSDLGAVAEGREGSVLLLDADPHADPSTLARPEAVWIKGDRLH
ncbi:MAG: amidohydrolase family protein [Alphaproteobacteria bacterium]|nr:amidohydrolase family protein [Alphaproteobacteria bacterium]